MRDDIHVICPSCGTEFCVAEGHGNAININDAPAGTYVLIPKKAYHKRMEALKNAGFDISNFFGTGSETGAETKPPRDDIENDEIEDTIISDGYVEGKSLWRRWVMAQMFRAINTAGGHDEYYKRYPYKYEWTSLLEELNAQRHIKDTVDLKTRQKFFNKHTVEGMFKTYIKKLKKLPDIRKHYNKRYKDREYFTIPYYSDVVFVKDFPNMVYALEETYSGRFEATTNPEQLYQVVARFIRDMIPLPKETTKSSSWRDAFIGAGSYYTLDNMIKFHNIKIYADEYTSSVSKSIGWDTSYIVSGTAFSQNDSLKMLNGYLEKEEHYALYKLLLKVIADNGYDYNTDPSIR